MSVRSKIIGILNNVFKVFSLSGTTRVGGTFGAAALNVYNTAGLGSTINSQLNDTTCRLKSDGAFGFSSSASDATTTFDVCAYRIAAGVMGMGTTGTGVGATWLQITGGEKRRTATQAVTNSTTFAADDTLSITLVAGRRYRFYIWYAFTTVNTSGVKLDLNGGAATMTAINGVITIYSSAMAVLAAAQITALTSTAGVTATGTLAFGCIEGSLECANAGTFIPRFAQNAETGAAESVTAQVGCYITLADVP